MTLKIVTRITAPSDLSPDSSKGTPLSSATTPSALQDSRSFPASHAKSNWISRWCAPLVLFLVGCFALGYYAYDILDAHFSQNDQSRRFDQAVRDAHGKSASPLAANKSPADQLHAEALADLKAQSAHAPTSPWPVLPNFDESSAPHDPSGPNEVTAPSGSAGNLPLGRIEIQSIGLSAMIQEGTGGKTLQRGVGHITGTAQLGHSGNAGLAGHRDTFFRKLRDIHKGDEIKLTTLAGSFVYRVELISIVEPDDSSVLRDSRQNILTLVTCYPFSYIGPAPKRFIVRARDVSSMPGSIARIN
jgi:sortase A